MEKKDFHGLILQEWQVSFYSQGQCKLPLLEERLVFQFENDHRSMPVPLLPPLRCPWVNQPDPLMPEDQWRYDDNYLMLGDMGYVYVSIDGGGDLHFAESCY